ncbi:Poly(A) polymerase pla1 [Hyphodiscus hymeniophilus]|uniref:Poly(A) polymerase pla1 n=1 Tax=Hyphodiscus hymeniophilus TaxID=353542 RepID=A0A9P6VF75_9HELO|nr:Poly(A) polymerase pla1 [Hyphodiscus hymeniophilus]
MASSVDKRRGITGPISEALPTPEENLMTEALKEELKRQNNYESAEDTKKRLLRTLPRPPPQTCPKGAITGLTCVPGARVPLIGFEYSGITIDLVYSRIESLSVIPDNLSLLDNNLLRELEIPDIDSLNGNRVTDEMLELVPQPAVFKTALRAVKLWAQRRAIYANIVGFCGGVAWAMCLARVCQLFPKATSSTMVLKFFRVIGDWNWPVPVLLKPLDSRNDLGLRVWNPKIYKQDGFHLMPIITPSYPQICSTNTVTYSTLDVMRKELKRGRVITEKIMMGKAPWKDLFVKHTFFTQDYKYYLAVTSSSITKEAQQIWSGRVESRVRLLVGELENHPSIALAHPFNKPFSRVHRCRTDEEVEKAKSGSIEYLYKAIPTEANSNKNGAKSEVAVVEKNDPNGDNKSDGEVPIATEGAVNGDENFTFVYTSTSYIGLELKEGAKSLDLERTVKEWKTGRSEHPKRPGVTDWELYDPELNDLSVTHTRNFELPDDVFGEGEVKATRPVKKSKKRIIPAKEQSAPKKRSAPEGDATSESIAKRNNIPEQGSRAQALKFSLDPLPPKGCLTNCHTRSPKLAPPRRPVGHPHHRQSLFRYLFPHPRQTARDRLTKLRFETLPFYKHRAQSRIYNYIVKRQVKRREKKATGTRILDILRRRGRRVFGGYPKDDETAGRAGVTMSGSLPGFGGGGGDGALGEGREHGARRRKLAGYLKAANDVRQSYQQSYAQKWGADDGNDDDQVGIPGAFPDVAIVSHGDEQLILFPSYAKRHAKEAPNMDAPRPEGNRNNGEGPGDAEYWAREWQRFEDDKAIVDVDIRGWIYSPHRGPMTRKNRLLIGLARQLSGIPAPKSSSRDNSPNAGSLRARHNEHEAKRDQEKIAQEAEQILKRGEGEEYIASHGDYSEKPKEDSDGDSIYSHRGRHGSQTPSPAADEPPKPGNLSKRASWNQPSDMSKDELSAANVHLMARLKPFLTNPLVSTPVTIFFYDENTSVSRTVTTNDGGHFTYRAALDFIPTHVRVLASEKLSATEEVKIMEPKGVSIISDVDDTIKHSSIGAGAREIFRNAFIRDLADLTIDGVREWYNTMYDMGVGFHYVSNSPWQLFPVLVSFFRMAGLPPGSYHLKQYSGMLQGIFEPVAERKKGTLEKIMKDFPDRKFILIGDSGEADLEVYTDVVLANPGKILAIFIRDVTTPASHGFFDPSLGPLNGDRSRGRGTPSRGFSGDSKMSRISTRSEPPEVRPALPPRILSEVAPQTSDGPTMGKLIDFDDEPEELDVHESHRRVMPRSASAFEELDSPRRKSVPDGSGKAPPPPRPTKPLALRGIASNMSIPTGKKSPPQPRKSRRLGVNSDTASPYSHPLSQAQSSADLRTPATANEGYVSSARNKVSAAYNALPEVRSYFPTSQSASRQPSSDSLRSSENPPPPPPRRSGTGQTLTSRIVSYASTDSSDDEASYRPNPAPVNKKLDLWKRRWKRAKEILDSQGVALRSWRIGEDVCLEAVHMVEKELTRMGVEGYGRGKGKTGQGGGEVKVEDLKR